VSTTTSPSAPRRTPLQRLLSPWPADWSRQRRSTANMSVAVAAMLLFLWALGRFLAYAPDPVGKEAQSFADGAVVTVELTLVSGAAGLLLGLLGALGRLSPVPPLRWLANLYIWVIRGTPLLVQILFVYFALPVLIPGLSLSEFSSACIALALNVGAYNAEAIRAGLLAVPKGQIEAARSLGLNRWFTFIDITCPQAFKISLPPLVNNIVALLKDSSLAHTIGVLELTNAGDTLRASSYLPVPALTTTALIYLALTTVMTHFSDAVERRFDIEGKLA
jgi:polar amino acid transport system permease protein